MDGGYNMELQFKISFILNNEISNNLKFKIIKLKQQYWNYPLKSQLKWMNENLNENDIHLCIFNKNDEIIAYLNIVKVNICDGPYFGKFSGIGNVCVDINYLKIGLGKLLIQIFNYFLKSINQDGLLICKPNLVNFYSKCGWKLFEGRISYGGKYIDNYLMCTKQLEGKMIILDKLF